MFDKKFSIMAIKAMRFSVKKLTCKGWQLKRKNPKFCFHFREKLLPSYQSQNRKFSSYFCSLLLNP
ncbi:MAG: hypothetical protein EA411_06615 [Saprospirales bacterium]|nr:MAG: hypothetical protein EA411_06615 [Saprospirales bacterium]